VGAILDNQLMPDEAVRFIRRDLENLYKHVHELGDQHDLVSKQLEEMSFDDNSEHLMLSNMMEKAGFSLFQLRSLIERLGASMEPVLDYYSKTEQNENFQDILDSCEQLNHITNDLVAE